MSFYFSVVKSVLLGVVDLKDTTHAKEINIARIVKHPEFRNDSRYNDIALLKLERPVEINSYVRPACLQKHFSIYLSQVITTGWTRFRATDDEGVFKITQYIEDFQTCNNVTSRKSLPEGVVNDIQLCTNDAIGNLAACQVS